MITKKFSVRSQLESSTDRIEFDEFAGLKRYVQVRKQGFSFVHRNLYDVGSFRNGRRSSISTTTIVLARSTSPNYRKHSKECLSHSRSSFARHYADASARPLLTKLILTPSYTLLVSSTFAIRCVFFGDFEIDFACLCCSYGHCHIEGPRKSS